MPKQLDFSGQAETVTAAPKPLDFSAYAAPAAVDPAAVAAFRVQHASDVPLPPSLDTSAGTGSAPSLFQRAANISAGAGDAITGSLIRTPLVLNLASGGLNSTLGLTANADADFARAQALQAQADQYQRSAQEASPNGAIAGNVLGIVPKLVAPEVLAVDALSHGSDLGMRAIDQNVSVPRAEALMAEGNVAGLAQNLLPGNVAGNLLTRALSGAVINAGTQALEQGVEHATAPEVVGVPTVKDAATAAGIGAILSAVLGHGSARPVGEGETLQADPLPQGLPRGADYSAKAEPVRPAPVDLGGNVTVNAGGEAFTPQQGAGVFADALAAARARATPAALGEPVVAVDAAGRAATTADQNAALQPVPPPVPDPLGLTDRQRALIAADPRTAREGAPIGPKALPPPVVTVDRTGQAQTTSQIQQAIARQQQAAAERQALGITPDIERTQGTRWAKQDQAAREEAARQAQLAELDQAISAKERPNQPARGRNAQPDETVDDALTFLAKRGGLDRRTFVKEGLDPAAARAPENRTRGGASRPLFRAQGTGGMSLDQVAETLWQHGYLPSADNNAALDLIMAGVNHDTPTYSIHRQDQGDLMALQQAKQDAENAPPADYADVPFSFAGERAMTADRGALVQAHQMEAMGRDSVPDRYGNQPGGEADTHIATGWSRGKDGKWRFEIDDSAATVNPAFLDRAEKYLRLYDENQSLIARREAIGKPETAGQQRDLALVNQLIMQNNRDLISTGDAIKVGDVLDHPDLLAAYPQLADVRVAIQPGGKSWGSYNAGTNTITMRSPGDYHASGDRSMKSVLLHEIQHAIQDHEGFARGGSAQEFRDKLMGQADVLRGRLDAIDRLSAQASANGDTAKLAVLKKEADRVQKEIEARGLNDNQIVDASHRDYRALAGEVEARNTQTRMNLPAAERRQLPPSETEDVPRSQQIVRFNNAGPAERSGPDAHDTQALATYNARLSQYIGKAVRFTPAAHVPEPAARALAAFDDAFGSHTIVVHNETPNALDLNGVTLRDGVRLVNEDATSPLLTVAAHEMVHQLRKDAPELYAELEAEVRRQGRLDAYGAELNARARASGENRDVDPRVVAEELTADATGDALSDPDFIERLAQQNPSLFRRLAQRLMDFFASVSQKLRGLGSSQYLRDVEAFRTKLADVLERYGQRQQDGRSKPPMDPSDPAFQRVYHGTPHTVDKFSLQKIGTGEGAQAYGWGLYFAGKREVALHYRDRLTDATAPVSTMTVRGERVDPDSPEGHGARLIAHNGKAEMKRLAKQMLADAKAGEPYTVETAQRKGMGPVEYYQRVADTIASVNKRDVTVSRGNVYKVEIPEDHDLLDNDAKIGEQNAKVQEVARSLLRDEGYLREGENGPRQLASAFRSMGLERGGMVRGPDGQLLYTMLAKKLGSEQAASQYLNEHGIPGMRYKAGQIAGVRNAGTNYVIWDEGAIGAPEPALSRKPAAADQTQTPEFRRWFGDSKVVDAEGKPLVVYHGTAADFDAFDNKRTGSNDAGLWGRGHYFASSAESANSYALRQGDGARVIPAYVSIKNPLILKTGADLFTRLPDGTSAKDLVGPNLDGSKIKAIAEAGRHDGVIQYKPNGGIGDVVAFRPEQIKSATGNRGNFDPNEPSILFSRKPVDDSEYLQDMPSRRPGESQAAYLRRITRKNGAEIKAATALVKQQRQLGRYALRGMMATHARQSAIADAALAQARRTFDKTPEVINFASVHEWETGQPITDPDFRDFVKTMQDGFDQRIAAIHRMAPGALESLIANYMPHLYEDSGKALKWYQNALGKRPMQGDRSFLKQREWPTLKDAMASGLKPISPNPVDWVLMKYHQMDKFIGLLTLKEDFARRGWLMKIDAGQRVPEGFARVDDPAFQIAGGLQGSYVVPEMIAKDINNYLAPGLSRYGAWRSIRAVQNAMVSWNLGWSAFHAGFTSIDNAVTHGAVGLQRLLDGDLKGGLVALVKAVPTMITSPFEGGKLNRQWTGQEATDPHVAALLDLLEQGGARMKMGSSTAEYNNALPQVLRTIRQLQAPGAAADRLNALTRRLRAEPGRGALEAGWGALKGAGKAISALGEVGSFLIHHVLVPNQKMAARVTLLKFELDHYAKALGKQRGDYAGIISVMNPDVAKQLASDVVDKVDFRLGQMTYDNFFYPKIAREIAQLLVMAPGWQAGAFQTMTGGIKDVGRLAKPEKLVGPLDKAGKVTDATRPRFTNNLANLIMLFLMVGGGNALYQWLVSGIEPDEMKDLVAPRTGRKNADDSDERLVAPSYMKDHYEFFHHPLAMASHKLHPAWRLMWELGHNEDYFGNMIRDPHHPLGKQAKELAGYLLKSMLPFTATNASKLKENGATAGDYAANFVGITPASASLTRTPFQAFVAKGGARGWDGPARTPAQAEYSDKMRKAENAMRTGQTPDLAGLTSKDVANLQRRVRTLKPEMQFDRLSLADKLDAYDMATTDERLRYHLDEVLNRTDPRRSIAFRRLPADEQQALLDQLERIRSHSEAIGP